MHKLLTRVVHAIRELRGQPLGCFVHTWSELPWSPSRPHRNLALLIDDKDTVRQSVVGLSHGVVHGIDEARKRELQLGDTFLGNRLALDKRGGLVDRVFAGNRDGPNAVGGMRLFDVHQIKLSHVTVGGGQLVDGATLAPKRRSRITTEDEHHRFLTLEGRQLNSFLALHAL